MDDPSKSVNAAIAAITPINSHNYRATVPLDHCHGPIAHGGFLSALIYKVLQQHFQTTHRRRDQLQTFHLHIVFLRPVTVGEVHFQIQDSKLGSDISTTHVTLVQEGKDKVVAYASNTNMQNDKGVTSDVGYEMTPKPTMADLDQLAQGTDARWVGFTFPGHPKSLLKASSHVILFIPTAGPPRPNITDAWLTPSSPHTSFTTEMLAYVADCWHRIPENTLPYTIWNHASIVSAAASHHQKAANKGTIVEMDTGRDPSPYWYPTLTLSLEIKKLLPAGGCRWLFMRAQVKEVRNGRMDAEIMILDQGMSLVALSHQICFVVENSEALEEKKKKRLSSREKL